VDRWKDLASQLITSENDSFQPVAALLQAWSVPCEIFRLDQQTFGVSYLFERSGRVRYGALVWLADGSSYADKNVAALEEAAQAGTSVVVVGSRFLDAALERLLGLKFRETGVSGDLRSSFTSNDRSTTCGKISENGPVAEGGRGRMVKILRESPRKNCCSSRIGTLPGRDHIQFLCGP